MRLKLWAAYCVTCLQETGDQGSLLILPQNHAFMRHTSHLLHTGLTYQLLHHAVIQPLYLTQINIDLSFGWKSWFLGHQYRQRQKHWCNLTQTADHSATDLPSTP